MMFRFLYGRWKRRIARAIEKNDFVQIPLWSMKTTTVWSIARRYLSSDSSMVDENEGLECYQGLLQKSSDSSMVDENDRVIPISAETIPVQIPLWSMKTSSEGFTSGGGRSVQIPLWSMKTLGRTIRWVKKNLFRFLYGRWKLAFYLRVDPYSLVQIPLWSMKTT